MVNDKEQTGKRYLIAMGTQVNRLGRLLESFCYVMILRNGGERRFVWLGRKTEIIWIQ